jgi:hypothetical protein
MLQPLVSEWAGGVELEPTDLYGMRIYQRGGVLLSHVDREETHALSAIINIAQGPYDEPWPLEIYDHVEHQRHLITMEPGEIVFYESARCMHGRPIPLRGDFYVNLFAHYRPRGDPGWFKKERTWNGEPPPCLDYHPECEGWCVRLCWFFVSRTEIDEPAAPLPCPGRRAENATPTRCSCGTRASGPAGSAAASETRIPARNCDGKL